jgi:hypothetical protein
MNNLRQISAVAAFFVLIGVGCLIAGGVFCFRTWQFVGSARTASGNVVRLDPSSDSHGETMYHTVFTFTDDSGSPHTVRTSYAEHPQPYNVGDRIVVLYPPYSPDDARIRSFSSLWLASVVLGGIGVVFPIAGLFAFSAARKTYGPP